MQSCQATPAAGRAPAPGPARPPPAPRGWPKVHLALPGSWQRTRPGSASSPPAPDPSRRKGSSHLGRERWLSRLPTRLDACTAMRRGSPKGPIQVGRSRQRHIAVSTAAARVAVLPSGRVMSVTFTTLPSPVTPPYVLKSGREPPWHQCPGPQGPWCRAPAPLRCPSPGPPAWSRCTRRARAATGYRWRGRAARPGGGCK